MYRRMLLLPVLALAVAGCGDTATEPARGTLASTTSTTPMKAGEPTIYEIAKSFSMAAEPEFKILTAALEASGLDAALDGRGQFTVFAPTDAAFAKLFGNPDFPYSPGELLADTELLTTVLLYHVARGKRGSEDVVTAERIRMMAAGFNFVSANDEGVYLVDTSSLSENAEIVLVDVPASNGVIHVIDEVLLP